MDNKGDNQQTTESAEDELKDNEADEESHNEQLKKHTKNTAVANIREAEKRDDTETDEEDSIHIVSSIKEFKRPTPLVTLVGTHTTDTATDSVCSAESNERMKEAVNLEHIMEDLNMPMPSTSKVVENVREYVKQIERRIEDDESLTSLSPTIPQASAAEIIDMPMETLKLETIKDASELSFTSIVSNEYSTFEEVERLAHEEVDRIVAENISPTVKRIAERHDFQQVERENQEIAERFKQIMEMFDSFTKNLESLEMPGLQQSEEVAESKAIPLRRRLSFKSAANTEPNSAGTVSAIGAAAGSNVYNEFYLEVHGECKEDIKKGETMKPTLAVKQTVETGLDPMYRDMATTVSGLELLDERAARTTNSSPFAMSAQPTQSLTTIGCQTASAFFGVCMTPLASTSYSQLTSSTAKEISPTEDDIVNEFNLESVTEPLTSTTAGIATTTFSDVTETTDITSAQPKSKFIGPTEQSAMVKIREPPTIIDLTQDSNAPRVTSIVTEATGPTNCRTTDTAPCERTYHTIHIEANSSPSSSVLRRPPLCTRFWNVITDFCAAVCLCLQVNKDCLFCLGFFIAFVVSASFLTAFFYRTLSINPHLLQVPVGSSSFASHVNSLQITQNEGS
ncbi:unnamed protein product [Ceratitis capitata]|uniref:(Mediterranean fruit fly) hypothetical protein n=1 Tax=Ceratitis capitata TaxID=7213 RepID=A0A811UGL2_CERCA|nr:unnamed protein product [Ceratitis capitata]